MPLPQTSPFWCDVMFHEWKLFRLTSTTWTSMTSVGEARVVEVEITSQDNCFLGCTIMTNLEMLEEVEVVEEAGDYPAPRFQ